MENATPIADIIVWFSPLVGGLALYLAHDAFSSIKEELKDLRERQVKTREDLSDLKVETRSVGDAVIAVKKELEANTETTKRLDARSGDTREMTLFMRTIEGKLSQHEANYGKVILILKRVVAILRPKNQEPPRE